MVPISLSFLLLLYLSPFLPFIEIFIYLKILTFHVVLLSDTPIRRAFLRVKEEFLRVKDWILYFNTHIYRLNKDVYLLKTAYLKQEKVNEHLFSILLDVQEKLEAVDSKISELDSKIYLNSNSIKAVETSLSKFSDLKNTLHELVVTLKYLPKDMSGHEKDMSGHEKDMSRNQGHVPTTKEVSVYSSADIENTHKSYSFDSLTPSEIYILNLLLHSNKPLTYHELSTRTGRKEKTIRNLIYSLRQKRIPVKDVTSSSKEKAFFIDESMKILLSGR